MNQLNLPAIRESDSSMFVCNGHQIRLDDQGRVNLTDMWRGQGSPQNKDPRQWRRKEGLGFIAHIAESLGVPVGHTVKATSGGKGGGGETYGHWQVALAYAKYLSHEFHEHVNRAYLEHYREECDPALKMHRAVRGFRKRGNDDQWIGTRMEGIDVRNALTDKMRDHNCKVTQKENPYAEATRDISLKVLGQTPKEIRESRGLAKSARTRDHLKRHELIRLSFAESEAEVLIERQAADGNAQCVDACRKAADVVKVAIDKLESR